MTVAEIGGIKKAFANQLPAVSPAAFRVLPRADPRADCGERKSI
jgi:hypothetical protein